MKIGVVSPFMPHDLADLLNPAGRNELAEIKGVLATPVTPMVREWHRKGHDLSIFCLDPSVSNPHNLRGERLSIHVLPKRRSRHCMLDFYREERRLIRSAVDAEAPKALSAQWTYDHALAAVECGVPTVVTCHDAPLRCAWIAKHWFMTYQMAVAWRAIRNADRLIAVSQYVATHIERYFAPKARLDIIPNGLAAEVFLRGRRRMDSGDPPPRPLTMCSVGSWGGLKNIATLMKAFSKIRKTSLSPARLVLFGPGLGHGQDAEAWAAHNGLSDGVVFHGPAPHDSILDFLEHETDLLVHPSLTESHGMALIEAIACGVPVIGGQRSGAVPWTLDQGRCGYLCDVRNPDALADAIVTAMTRPDRNRALIECAWSSVRERFLMDAAAEANERILLELAGNSPASAP